jgi:Uma2 family endonuclease
MPLLAVEVLSKNVSRDTVLKASRYARAGLPQYWLVNPEGGLEILNLESAEGGLFRSYLQLTDAPEKVTLADGTQVTIDPSAVFAP